MQIGEFFNLDRGSPLLLNEEIFRGTLAPLVSISKKLQLEKPALRFVLILDEFDEIHPEMYRSGRLAEAVFANLRSLSSQRNIAFIMVGGEKMPYVMGAQGDQLNQFVREELTYFSRVEEWDDLRSVITRPVEGLLTLRDAAVNEIAMQAAGHPYYTKLLCTQVFRDAVRSRDADITKEEVLRSLARVVIDLDVNAFAHYWKDGIQAGEQQEEAISLSRARLLACVGRALRNGRGVTAELIAQQAPVVGLASHEIQPLLNDFCRRGILREVAHGYECIVPLFEHWLREVGANRIIVDTLGDELAAKLQIAENDAYVKAAEIVELTDRWGSYRGRSTGTDDVRQWLNQVQSNEQQRYLFTILQNIRFVTETEIREKLRLASGLITAEIPGYVRKSKVDRRRDVIVTYVDGPGKSGSYYASKFAEENHINSKAVLALDGFVEAVHKYEATMEATTNAVIIVDDVLGTGKSLSENLRKFLETCGEFLRDRSAFLGVVGLFSTKDGESRARKQLKSFSDLRCDLRICELLGEEHYAFPTSNDLAGIWDSPEKRDNAKALCLEIGARIYKNNPLGYGGEGLLLVLPNTVPNNTLPILHSFAKGGMPWRPLFERPIN
jgi:hypothetical protein